MFTCLPTLQKKEGATFTWAHQKEDQMIKFYLKDAFFTVSIAPQSQHLLHFINEGTRYQFWCLPFGLDPPPCFYLPSFKTNCSLPMKTVILKKVLHWGAYSSTWKQESNWWDQRKMYPYFSIVASVADYFTGLGNIRAPLTTIDQSYWHFTHPLRVEQHELICEVVIACFIANLPQPRYVVTCNVNKMLDYIHSLMDNSTLSDKCLTLYLSNFCT